MAEMGKVFSKTFSSPWFLLKSRKNDKGFNRFATIISNKAVPKSTHRHFYKRFFASRLMLWPNLGKDCIIIASPRFESVTHEILDSQIEAALENILKK